MSLPIDIRMMIYDELFLYDVDLYRTRCESCPAREAATPTDSANPVSYAHLACTQILRTNKQICSEAIARLYSKNTVQVRCRKCEASESDLLDLRPCLVEPYRDLSTHYDRYYPHVKNIAILYELDGVRPYYMLVQLTARWPIIDDKIIRRYENTKHISLRIRLPDMSEITVDLARRIHNPSTERVHDYESVLAQVIANDQNDEVSTLAMAALEEVCDELVLSHARGNFKSTAFAVRSIRWRPSKKDTKETVVYLGCDKHVTSDAFINLIPAKMAMHYEARRRLLDDLYGEPGTRLFALARP